MEVKLETSVTMDFITSAAGGGISDADSPPSFEVFESDNDTALTLSTSSIAKRTAKTGNYRATFTVAAADGFEAGKYYNVIASATVGSVAGKAVIGRFKAVTNSFDDINTLVGGVLTFAPNTDNASSPLNGITKAGTQTNTYAATVSDNGIYHTISHATNNIDWVYGFSVVISGIATGIFWKGYVSADSPATAKSITVKVYNFEDATWDTKETIAGQAGIDDITINITLTPEYTGTGANAGKVYVEFVATAQTGIVLNTDQLLVTVQSLGWTLAEKEQIRSALGIDGNKTEATGGQLQAVGGVTDTVVNSDGELTTIRADLWD